MTRSQRSLVHPQTYGWVNGELLLTDPKHLIIRQKGRTPQVIRVEIPHYVVMAILQKGISPNQTWKVFPHTYPVNGIISQFEINELPSAQDKSAKDGLFSIIGPVAFRHEDKLKVKILTKEGKEKGHITITGDFPERYKLGDILYIKAKFANRQLHLVKCCSDLEFALKYNDKRLFSFTLNSYPQFLPYSAQVGMKQFWAPHGSEKIAILLGSQKLNELDLLKSGQYIASIQGKIEKINGMATLINPIIKTSVKLFEDEDDLFSTQNDDSPRARMLGTEVAYQQY